MVGLVGATFSTTFQFFQQQKNFSSVKNMLVISVRICQYPAVLTGKYLLKASVLYMSTILKNIEQDRKIGLFVAIHFCHFHW